MISVLIPIYNYNVLGLVEEIQKQLLNEKVVFEIICIDDYSTLFFEENLKLQSTKNVQFIQLEKNIGRSKIRNLLVHKSKYDWLLFLDADVIPESNLFIKNYLKEVEVSAENVFYGGVLYEDVKPEQEGVLRWTYGRNREKVDFEIRQKKPYNYFLGANFLIQKEVFNKVSFNEDIIEYGYEDTLFVEELRVNNIKLKQLKNRVYHLGLENNDVFLSKTRLALHNLKKLNSKNLINAEYVKVLKVYNSIKLLNPLFEFIWKNFHKKIENNLKGNQPSMFLFDLYKLSYYCYING